MEQTEAAGAKNEKYLIVAVCLLTLAAGVLHFAAVDNRGIWYDEGHTFAITRDGLAKTIDRLRRDVHPPLYFLAVSLILKVDDSELALRLVSVVAATLLVPVVYRCARMFTTARGALLAAALAASSPLVHNYAVDARAYALLPLTSAIVLFVFTKAMTGAPTMRTWIAYTIALAALLNVHNFGAFLLPVPILLALAFGGERRRTLVLGTLRASAVAFLTYLPWFWVAVHAEHGTQWIEKLWRPDAYVSVLRSLEVFGVGGDYPINVRTLLGARSFRVVSIPLTAALLCLAWSRWQDSAEEKKATRWILTGFLFGPLLITQAYSFLRQPIYLVGRYDIIALPPFLILYALGLEKLLRRPFTGVGVLVIVVVGVLTAVHLNAASRPLPDLIYNREWHELAKYLQNQVKPDEPIVFVGDCRSVVEYQLHRTRRPFTLISYPDVLSEIPGSFDPNNADFAALDKEAQGLAERLIAKVNQGAAVWLVHYAQPGKTYLIDRLIDLDIDEARSRPDLFLFCLVARRPADPVKTEPSNAQ